MRANEIRHQSKLSQDHKRLEICLQWIRMQRDEGIKRGNLIIKSGVPFSQWVFFHQILVDLDEILWDKATHTYTSMDASKYPKQEETTE